MTLTSKPLAALVIAILFGGIIFSSALGWWQTESTKEAATFTSGDFAGMANPADIRGSYTFGDVETNFNIPAALLAQAFQVQTDDPAAYPVKSLEGLYESSVQEVGTASVRLFVAFYLNMPFDLSTDMYLPETAAKLLRQKDLTAEQTAYLGSHTIDSEPDATKPEAENNETQPMPTVTPIPETQVESSPAEDSEKLVKGKTTFAELLEWGMTQESIERVLGMPMPAAPGIKVKDFCSANGLSFETIKASLQSEVDQVK